MDLIPDPNEIRRLGDLLLAEYGTAFFCSVGVVFLLFSYAGMHWIERRKFYRRKLADPFRTYFKYRVTRTFEGWLGILFIAAGCLGFLCVLGGVIDWIDG